MMGDIITLAWVAAFGGWVGFHLSEHRHRNDLPQWKAALGDALVVQMKRVADGHMFAGDDVEIRSTQTYSGKFGQMVVIVERAEVDA